MLRWRAGCKATCWVAARVQSAAVLAGAVLAGAVLAGVVLAAAVLVVLAVLAVTVLAMLAGGGGAGRRCWLRRRAGRGIYCQVRCWRVRC